MYLAPIVAGVLIGLNWLLAKSNPNIDKAGPFEYGLIILIIFLMMLVIAFILEIQLRVLKIERSYDKDRSDSNYYDHEI